MSNINRKIAAFALCLIMLVTMAGCASENSGASATQAPAAQTNAPASSSDAAATQTPEADAADAPTLPLAETRTISVYDVFNAKYVGKIETYADMPWYQYLAEKANITWDFIQPSTEIAKEQFGLMIASRDLPDVISSMDNYPGGDYQAYTDGVIIALNDAMDAGYTPNMKQFYATFPRYDSLIRKSSGEYLGFPHIRVGSGLNSNGLIVRKDLLDAAGLEIPATIDEWDTALRAFKEQGVIPFSPRDNKWLNTNMPFISAWNMTYFEYNDGGVVKYGAVQPEFKEYLALMNKWYTDGLLDPDYLTSDSKILTAKVSAGLVGSYVGAAGGNLKNPWYAIVEENPESTIEYAGAPVPKLTKDAVSKIGPRYDEVTKNIGYYITSQAENPEEVALILDFIYSQEASQTMYFGIEGEHYVIDENGLINPWVVDADGKVTSMAESWGPARSETPSADVEGIIRYDEGKIYNSNDPAIVAAQPMSAHPDAVELAQRHIDEVRQAALDLWVSFDAVNRMPALLFTTEESSERADIYGDLETYVYEQVTKFIIGTRSLDEFDKFVEECYSLGLENALAIAQACYDAQIN